MLKIFGNVAFMITLSEITRIMRKYVKYIYENPTRRYYDELYTEE